jgi:tRNA-splicing ligase RtcB
MNARQLEKLGIPHGLVGQAVQGIQHFLKLNPTRHKELKGLIKQVVDCPEDFRSDPCWSSLAAALQSDSSALSTRPAIAYRTWGEEIDIAAHSQMEQACRLPVAVAAALMPDAHVGYGLPIGGVLATEGAVIPYAVGVDIACRMKLSILDIEPKYLRNQPSRFVEVLERGTRFGIGAQHEKPQDHPVLDADWSITRITREKKDLAHRQLGTSGSGNHFVEFGTLTIQSPTAGLELPVGSYTALLSHSGSRGTGASVCAVYSRIARSRLPRAAAEDFGQLAWLTLDSEAGQEYWAAMNLMGDYAAANHEVIHRLVGKLLGARVLAGVENHHNFAWKEEHAGREWIVHRKGATPAAVGQLGVIPGSMGTPGFVVRGRGQPESLCSAAHGAGRRMSRTAARDQYRWPAVRRQLEAQGIRVLSAGADEVPMVYKDIHQVMAAQQDLVEVVAQFDPWIVKMCGDHSRAED